MGWAALVRVLCASILVGLSPRSGHCADGRNGAVGKGPLIRFVPHAVVDAGSERYRVARIVAPRPGGLVAPAQVPAAPAAVVTVEPAERVVAP